MRRDFFSTSVASPAVQQLPASTLPVTVPVVWNPTHAPAHPHCLRDAVGQRLTLTPYLCRLGEHRRYVYLCVSRACAAK